MHNQKKYSTTRQRAVSGTVSLILAVMLLSSCSTLDIAKTAGKALVGGGGGKTLDVQTELVVGDKTETKNTELQSGDRTSQTIEAQSVVNKFVSGLSTLELVIMILGWMAPSPGLIWRELKHITKTTIVGVYNGLIGILKAIRGK